ncbi:P-loop containing nucleoside triphosphate hydrolase protein [Xylaria sp. CBS 124048]|nr:P-loop containing nucleoside triphosphate hydrolase protein [Xylaria sp. CBS 124048]
MTSSRYIDTVPVPATEDIKEKKIIILSYSRSGTRGLCDAMELLGFTTYNMTQAVLGGYPHLKMFTEALEIKRTKQGRPYSRVDFDKWMTGFDTLSIVPCYLTEEIVQAYPDAKFILTVREPEAWARSIWNTIGLIDARARSFPLNVSKYFDSTDLEFARLVSLIFDTTTRGYGRTEAGFHAAMSKYEKYNKMVEDLVPADRLLVVKLEDGLGWEQICPFLEVDTPAIPYPRTNDTKQFQIHSKRLMQGGKRRAIWFVGAVGAVTLGLWLIS